MAVMVATVALAATAASEVMVRMAQVVPVKALMERTGAQAVSVAIAE
jgi:hypothetical protein